MWETVPVCLPRDGNGTGRRAAIWLTGRDGSPRFVGEMGEDHGTGREQVGKSVGHIVAVKLGREHSQEIGRERSREMAGRCNPEGVGTRSGTRAGDNGSKEGN